MNLPDNNTTTTYKVQVQGELDQDWFNGLEVTVTNIGDRPPLTTITVPVADQAALRGLLCKLWDLNLTLIFVQRMITDATKEKDNE